MALDPNRWTLKTQEAFQAAIDNARARSNAEVTPDHLLAALLGQEEGVVLSVLQRAGVAPLTVRNRTQDALDRLPKAYGGGDPQLSRATRTAAGRRATNAGAPEPAVQDATAEAQPAADAA